MPVDENDQAYLTGLSDGLARAAEIADEWADQSIDHMRQAARTGTATGLAMAAHEARATAFEGFAKALRQLAVQTRFSPEPEPAPRRNDLVDGGAA